MKKTLFCLLALLAGLYAKPLLAQHKINYGIRLGLFQTKLNHVDREHFSGYGYSAPGFIQNDRPGFTAHLLATKSIAKNISFETGLGVSTFRSQFHFDKLQHVNRPTAPTLDIALYYLSVPLMFNYKIPLKRTAAFEVSLGPDIRCLLLGNDNYPEIIEEDIYLDGVRNYKQLIISPQLAFGYSFRFNNDSQLRLAGNIGLDAQKAMRVKGVMSGWGFYSNLSTAYYTYYGLSINYFFSRKPGLG